MNERDLCIYVHAHVYVCVAACERICKEDVLTYIIRDKAKNTKKVIIKYESEKFNRETDKRKR